MRSHCSSLPIRLSGRVESSAAHGQAERLVDERGELEAADHLVLDLLPGAEDVGVVLRDVAHAHQAVHHARRPRCDAQALLGEPERQVAVAAPRVVVDLDVTRAVHRLEAEDALVGLDEEHVLAVVVPVPRALPQLGVEEDRRRAPRGSRASRSARARRPSSAFQIAIPFGCQNGEPGETSEKWNEVELRAEPAMIAPARLLELVQVLVELLLG